MSNNKSGFRAGRDQGATTENIELLTGQRGNGLDRAVTVRDLSELGIATLRRAGQAGQSGILVPNSGSNLSPGQVSAQRPTQPMDLAASGAFHNVILTWSEPNYRGHALTEIWRSPTDNLAQAVLIGTTVANIYPDAVGGAKVSWYWVRFVNALDVEGAFSGPGGVRGETSRAIDDILGELAGKVGESELTQHLTGRVDLIDGPASLPGSVAQRVASEAAARALDVAAEQLARTQALAKEQADRADDFAAEATARSQEIQAEAQARALALQAEAEARIADLTAEQAARSTAIITERDERLAGDSALAQDLTLVNVKMDSANAAILNEKTARATADSALTSEIAILSAQVNAAPTFISGFEAGSDIDRWIAPVGTTITGHTGSAYSGDQSALISSAHSGVPTALDALHIALPDGTAQAFSSYELRITLAAVQPLLGASAEFAVCYDTDGAGGSGWQVFTPQDTWAEYEFSWVVPEGVDQRARLSIWADTSNSGLSLIVDALRIRRVAGEIHEVTAAITAEQVARAQADEALTSRVDALTATTTNQDATLAAAIIAEQEARTTADTAMATRIDTLAASSNTDELAAAITTEQQARVAADTALASDITALTVSAAADKLELDAAIIAEREARVDAVSAVAQETSSLSASFEVDAEIAHANSQVLGAASALTSNAVHSANANLLEEKTVRANANEALSQQITTLSASIETDKGDLNALIVTEQQARATADAALTGRIDALTASTNLGNSNLDAAITSEQEARATADTALGKRVDTVTATASSDKAALAASVTTERDARVSADTALGQRIDTLVAKSNDNTALVQQEQVARADADTALAQSVQTVQTSADQARASVQTLSQTVTQVNANGTTAHNALWSVKAQAGDVTAGIGLIAKSGGGSEVAVAAGRFSVFDPANPASKNNLFVVEQGKTYMNTAFIKQAYIEGLVASQITADKINTLNLNAVNITGGSIRGTTLNVGANFSVTSNGDMGARNAWLENATLAGTLKVPNAFVETIHIKGQAVTFPVSVTSFVRQEVSFKKGSTSPLITTSITINVTDMDKIYIQYGSFVGFTTTGAWQGIIYTRLDTTVGNSRQVHSYPVSNSTANQVFPSFGFVEDVSNRTGNFTIHMRQYIHGTPGQDYYNNSNGTLRSEARYLSIIGLKR